jgi:multidrug transporter EmrE-like cation transporter
VTLPEFLLFLAAVLVSSGGQAFLKLGALKLGPVEAGNAVEKVLNILRTPELLFGLVLYGISAVLFILVLTRVKLSVAAPAVSITYIISVLIGYFFFKEPISGRHLIGFALIICGVILVIKR